MKIIILMISILVVIGCKKENQDGVVQVEYKKKYDVKLVDTLIIKHTDSVFIGGVKDICVIKDNIYIADYISQDIKCYDKNLKFVKNLGRKGQGPGEFLESVNLTKHNDTLITAQSHSYNQIYYYFQNQLVKNEKTNYNFAVVGDPPLFFDFKNVIAIRDEKYNIVILDKTNNENILTSQKDLEIKKESKNNYVITYGVNLSQGIGESFFVQQIGENYFEQYNLRGELLKKYVYQPKYKKGKTNFTEEEVNLEKDYVKRYKKYWTHITLNYKMFYDKKNKLVCLAYMNFPKEKVDYFNMLLNNDNYIMTFNEDGICVFDEEVAGYFYDIEEGYIYTCIEESQERIVLLKYKLKEV